MLVPGGGKKAPISDDMPCGSVVDAARNSLYCPTSLDQQPEKGSESGVEGFKGSPKAAPRHASGIPRPKPRSGKTLVNKILFSWFCIIRNLLARNKIHYRLMVCWQIQ